MESLNKLRKLCQKTRLGGQSWYAREIIFKISVYLTRFIVIFPVTGNQITTLMIFAGLTSGLLFWTGKLIYFLTGAICLQLFFLLDCVDGEVARYRGESSLTGTYFDGVSHYLVHPFIFFSIGLGLFNCNGKFSVLLLGCLAAFGSIINDIIADLRFKALVIKLLTAGDSSDKRAMFSVLKKQTFKVPRVKKLIYILSHYPAIMNIITLATIMDFFGGLAKPSLFGFSFLYFVLICYAISLPILAMLKMIRNIRNQAVDVEYNSLFKITNNDNQ